MRRLHFPLLLALGLIHLGGVARADDLAAAAQSFKAGTDAFQQQRYAVAAAAFERADGLARRGAALHNAALSWEAAGELARASDDFAAALERADLAETQRGEAASHLTTLRKQVGWLHVTAPPRARVSVAHVDAAFAERVIHLTPGSYTVTVTLEDGRVLTRSVSIQAGSEAALAVREPSSSDKLPATDVATPGSSPTSASSPSTMRLLGWVAVGATAACAITTGLAWNSAVHARDDFEASARRDEGAHDRASRWETITNIGWVGTGVFGAAGIVLLVLSYTARPPRASQAVANNLLAPHGTGLVHLSW